MGAGMLGYTARTGKTLVANDVMQEPHYIDPGPGRGLTAAESCVPIVSQMGAHSDKVIGVLDVHSQESGVFGPDDVRAMETLAVQLGIAIHNAALFEQTQQRVAELAALLYERPSERLTVVGVTGTNGKTTTTSLLASVLDAAGLPCGRGPARPNAGLLHRLYDKPQRHHQLSHKM